ncbi:MAG: hypothetical protein PHH46_10535, partial [Firmicutes bacterium]|nr:hypothetical protein [Bacillota bacterium]
LYLEYKRANTPQFMTTGIGLKARRGAAMDFWGFVIHDGRRIGLDLVLYKTEFSADKGEEQKIPLTRRQLEDELGAGGRVVRTQREYMELVNRYVFGFDSLEAFDELIQLLIQLRTPKLSREFKPTVIYEILDASLPALSDDELRPLSDTIENMDQIKQQLEQVTRDRASIARLCKQYDLYNQFVLAEKAQAFANSVRRRDRLESLGKELVASLEQRQAEKAQCDLELDALERERRVLADEETRLKEHDVFKAEQQKQGLEAERANVEKTKSHKQSQLSSKQQMESYLRNKLQECEAATLAAESKIRASLATMKVDAAEAQYEPCAISVSRFEQDPGSFCNFVLWRKEAEDHLRRLESVRRMIREHGAKHERYQETQLMLGEAQKQLDLARNEEHRLETTFEEAKDSLTQAVHHWRKGCEELRLTGDEMSEISRRISQLYEPHRYSEARAPEEDAHARALRAIESEMLKIEHAMSVKQRGMDEKEAELAQWRSKNDPEPPRCPESVAARKRLSEAGVPHAPFFAAVEFHDEVPDDLRGCIESAITEMGLLDAIIVPRDFDIASLDSDRIIRPEPQILARTLADFLRPAAAADSGVSEGDIQDALASVLVVDSTRDLGSGHGTDAVRIPVTTLGPGPAPGPRRTPAALTERGAYRIGIIEGSIARINPASFIGREARRRFREQTIARLEAEFSLILEEHRALESELGALKARQRRLGLEHRAFPQDAKALAIFEQLAQVRLEIQAHQREAERCNEKVKQAYSVLHEARARLVAAAEGLKLEAAEDAYDWAVASMKEYVCRLHETELTQKELCHNITLSRQHEEGLASVAADSAELVREIDSLSSSLDEISLKLEQVRARLSELGADEIRLRVAQVVDRLSAIPAEMQELARRSERAAAEVESIERKIAEHAQELDFAQSVADACRRVFVDEERLDFVNVGDSSGAAGKAAPGASCANAGADQDAVSALDGEAQSLIRAKAATKKLGHLLARSNLDRETVTNRLTKSFYEEARGLMEYRPTIDLVLESELPVLSGNGEAEEAEWEQLRQRSRRLEVLMDHTGKRVSPYFVLDQLDQDIELQRRLLSEKDRELYEEIIMNSVGRIIRERISRAEQWVKRIRGLMAE